MQFDNIKLYLKRVVTDGHKWQYTDITNNGRKPKLFFSSSQIVIIIIALGSIVLMPKGFNSDFIGYVINALSIFIGLFLTLILSVFDKFQNFKKIEMPTQEDKIYLIKRKNYFQQFTSLTSYAIVLSLICIVLLSILLLTDSLNDSIFAYSVSKFSEIDTVSLKRFVILISISVYNASIIYFLLDFMLIVLYAVVSTHTYMMVEYNKE